MNPKKMISMKTIIITTIIFLTTFQTKIIADGLFFKAGGYIPLEMSLSVDTNIENYPSEKEQEIDTSVNYLLEANYRRTILKIYDRNLYLGIGISYEGEPRSQKNLQGIGFSYIPLYLITAYDLFENENFKISLFLGTGYNFLDITNKENEYWDEISGGIYIKTGIEIMDQNNYVLDISYNLTNSSFKETALSNTENYITSDYSYSKISITLGKALFFLK